MSDERLGLPSSSMADRVVNCPGSPIPSGDGGGGENAERGSRIHEALRLRQPSMLEGDEERVYWSLLSGRDRVYEQWSQGRDCKVTRDDLRLFLRDKAMRRIFSGQPDEICSMPDSILVIDFKTGPVDPIENNWQLRSYAVLASVENGGGLPVRAAVIQDGREDVIDWTQRDLLLFEAELREAIARMKFGGVRRGGHWCKWCPARGNCPQSSFFALAIRPTNIPALTINQIAEIHRNRSAIISILDEVAEAMKSMSDEDLAKVGFRRRPNAPMRQFTDMEKVFVKLMENNVKAASIQAAVKLSIGDAEKLIREANGCTKPEAKTILNEICSGLIAKVPKADSLEAV